MSQANAGPSLTLTDTLMTNQATTSNGTTSTTTGYSAALVQIVESNGGTATINLQGSFDNVTFYNLGFQQIDATASPARSVSAISVGANTTKVYQLLDLYPYTRAALSAPGSSPKVTIKLYKRP